MMYRYRLVTGCAAALFMTAGALALAQDAEPATDNPPRARATFEERYGVLTQNNIFVRDRRPAPPPNQQPTTRQAPAAPPVPERDWVLIGVVFEDGQFRAYFENLRGRPTTRAVVGDAIADGIIDRVYLDAVAYQLNGQTIWVDIGQDLTGAAPRGASATASRAPEGEDDAASGDDGAIDENADPSTLSLEERMRLRRQQETGSP